MQVRGLRLLGKTLLCGSMAVALASPAMPAGFGIFEQGAKAMGMAGAFTAQADDPSALFHNVGGLGFFEEREISVGFTYITQSEAEYIGSGEFAGATGELETLAEVPPHLYWIQPIGERLNFGLSVNVPYGLTTDWEDPGNFPGRFLSTRAALRTFDIAPSIGWRLSDNFSVGLGAIVRLSDVELDRAAPVLNLFSQQVVDAAEVELVSDLDEGFGFQLGLLHKVNNSFSWGFNYKGEVEIDYGGDARFTQVSTGSPELDFIVSTQIPFGSTIPISTTVEFPASASLGFAFAVSPNVVVETDVNWTGWSSLEEVVIEFDSPLLADNILSLNWEDVYNYRIGLKWMRSVGREWRFGYVFDENPIADEELGPLLPDADRNGFTVGYGRSGGRFGYDLALMYLPFEERDVTTNEEGFNGTYNTTAWLLGLTLNF